MFFFVGAGSGVGELSKPADSTMRMRPVLACRSWRKLAPSGGGVDPTGSTSAIRCRKSATKSPVSGGSGSALPPSCDREVGGTSTMLNDTPDAARLRRRVRTGDRLAQ